jgi:hypothetical protein
VRAMDTTLRYFFTRSAYSALRVSMRTSSPCSMKSGT